MNEPFNGLKFAKQFKPEALKKLEQFLIDGTNRAILDGYTIVCRCYSPREFACDPIYAACLPGRKDPSVQFDWQLPSYEEIFSDAMGEPRGSFDWTDLRALMDGIDSEKPFMHHTFYIHPHRNEEVFNIGRRLRHKYIVEPARPILPDFSEHAPTIACITETEAAQYAETGELSNALFGHVNFCATCRGKLETAKEFFPVQQWQPDPNLFKPSPTAISTPSGIRRWEEQQIKSLMGWMMTSLRSARSWFHRTMWGAR